MSYEFLVLLNSKLITLKEKGEKMMIGKKIIEGLVKANTKPVKLTASDHALEVHVELEDFDRLGCLLKNFEIFMKIPCEDKMEDQANNVADKITYLIDRFTIVELDNLNQQVLLRSERPLRDETSLLYDEIIIRTGNHLKLQRVCFDMERKERRDISSHLSLDLLAKLVTDLTTCMQTIV